MPSSEKWVDTSNVVPPIFVVKRLWLFGKALILCGSFKDGDIYSDKTIGRVSSIGPGPSKTLYDIFCSIPCHRYFQILPYVALAYPADFIFFVSFYVATKVNRVSLPYE